MELKVVRGPFDAVVRLDKHELTLMVQNRYAGRFPIGVGRDQPKLDGEYTVRDKTLNPAYYGPDGVTISPNDPKNPLGGAWIGLTDRIGIHGTNDPQGDRPRRQPRHDLRRRPRPARPLRNPVGRVAGDDLALADNLLPLSPPHFRMGRAASLLCSAIQSSSSFQSTGGSFERSGRS